jgi:cytoskeletal protein CcmA (bactofilin family)
MWADRRKETTLGGGSAEPRSDYQGDSKLAVADLGAIGRAIVIKGDITSKESLFIDGEVVGRLDLIDSRLTVGPNGRVTADITAREIEILGSVNGDLDATKRIAIRTKGRLVGDLRTPAIVIEEGAYFKGKIEIIESHMQQTPK